MVFYKICGNIAAYNEEIHLTSQLANAAEGGANVRFVMLNLAFFWKAGE